MADERFDPWRTLGVPVGADPEDIRRAFRTLARRMHPDVNRGRDGAHEQFIRLRQAYETLMDDRMRARLERDALSADVDTLIIIEDFEVTLGDAYELLDRGYLSEARDLYLELAREHPGDPRLLELLEFIHRAEERTVGAGVRATPPPRPHTEEQFRERYRDLWQPEPTEPRLSLAVAAAGVIAGCVISVRAVDAPPAVWGFSLAEITLAAVAGSVGMGLLAASGVVRSFDRELGGMIGDAGREAPMWLYLGAAGLVSPVLALVFYLIFTMLQTQWSWQVAGFFAGSFGIAALFAWAHGGDWALIMFIASNAIFVPGLVGWAFGSIFRPGEWWE